MLNVTELQSNLSTQDTAPPSTRRNRHPESWSPNMRRLAVLTALAITVMFCAGRSVASPALAAPAPAQVAAAASSSAVELDHFVTAARTADSRLRSAAQVVNGSLGRKTIVVTTSTARTVQRTRDAVLAVPATLPAGMPAGLRDAALLVYSDLTSRQGAMSWAGYPATYRFAVPRTENGYQVVTAWDMVESFGNGHEAAVAFGADLARLQALAGHTRFVPKPATSPSALDVAVRVEEINGRNYGCASTGGYRATEPAVVKPTASRTGTTDGVEYKATVVRGRWHVEIMSC